MSEDGDIAATTSPAGLEPAGLETVRRFLASSASKPGIGRTLGISGLEADQGRVVLIGSPTEEHYNPLGAVHGGYVATMLDSAIALAVQTTLGEGLGGATTDLKIAFVRPLTVASGPVRCEGRILNKGRTLVLGEAHVTDARGRLCAHATASCMVAPFGDAGGRSKG